MQKNSHLYIFLSRTPNSTKSNGGLNPEADEFVPVFSVNIYLLFNDLKRKIVFVSSSVKVVLDQNHVVDRQPVQYQ
jgi:hypothetical protein